MGAETARLRWLSLEFTIYYSVIALALTFGLRAAYKFSLPTSSNYKYYGHALSNGWLFGRKIDNSDAQWQSFRNSIPQVLALFTSYVLISQMYNYICVAKHWWSLRGESIKFKAVMAIVGIFILHGFNFIKVLTLTGISYYIGRLTNGSKSNIVLTWTYVLAVLFGLEYLSFEGGGGYPGSTLLSWINSFFLLWPGFFPRWQIIFKVTILRLISFNMDYHYTFFDFPSLQCGKSEENGTVCTKRRIQEAPPMEMFNFTSFIAYVLYLPLYIAGPIITFNDFISQVSRPIRQKPATVILYGIRLIGSFLTIEIILHLFYVVSIKNNKAWEGFNALDFTMLTYLNLKVVWLKLLIIWRFFRLVALTDGIITQENMIRCMSNNYSGLAFWRSWHRSFNQWVIRYMYIPMGGSKRVSLNTWPIFTFVAIWHDIRFNLIVWSWLICLFIMPEVILGWMSLRFKWEKYSYYRQFCAIGAAGNMFLMSIANSVGFVVGVEGLGKILNSFTSFKGVLFFSCLMGALYCHAQVLFEIRGTERFYGIKNNY